MTARRRRCQRREDDRLAWGTKAGAAGVRRFVALSCVIALSAVASAFAFADEAFGCSWTAHCWGVARWVPATSGYTGVFADIKTTNLRSDAVGSCNRFSNATMWRIDFPNNLNWIEAGWTIGYRHPSADVPGCGLALYWAEKPTCGNYKEHYGNMPVPSYGTYYGIKISENGGGKWAVYVNGVFKGNSAACYEYDVGAAEVGYEITDDNGLVNGGRGLNLQKRGSSGTWSYQWGGSYVLLTPNNTSNVGEACWNNVYQDLVFIVPKSATTC